MTLWGLPAHRRGPYARAEFYRRGTDRSYRLVAEPLLRNPVAPVEFIVTDRGCLVTFDNWHNMGYGIAVAGYSPQGRGLFAYDLKDLFSAEEIAAFVHSTSSIWWRKGRIYVREGQRSVYVTMDDKGTELIVDARDWRVAAVRMAGGAAPVPGPQRRQAVACVPRARHEAIGLGRIEDKMGTSGRQALIENSGY